MDDVFGNCSGETVMEADLSRVLANLHQDIADLQYLQQQARTPSRQSKSTMEAGMKPEAGRPVPQPRTQAQASSLRHTQSEVVGRVFQSPRPRALSTGATTHHNYYVSHYHHNLRPQQRPHHGYVNLQPRSSNLKQCSDRPTSSYDNVPEMPMQISHSDVPHLPLTQSNTNTCMIPKSTFLSLQQPVLFIPPPPSMPPPQTVTHMPPSQSVVSMPPPLFTPILLPPQSTTTLPVPQSSTPQIVGQRYMNVPLPAAGLSPVPALACSSQTGGGSNSAPPTPQHMAAPYRLHHSYIELWSGVREERDSFSDSECEELKRSFQEPQTSSSRPSPGYVQMSSPYIKSPQVESPFTGSVLADFASRLASYAGHQPRNIFCPFCPRYFGYEKSLGSHIHKAHRTELNTMVESGCREVKLQLCPICQAQFFNTSVLPKHLIDFHRASVVEVLEKNNCILSDAVGIQCPFCSKKVPHGKTGEQVLLYHMQQLHLSQYEEMVNAKFRPTSRGSLESLGIIAGSEKATAFQPGITSTPGLSNRIATLAVQARTRRSVEALDLDTTWSSHTATIKSRPLQLKPRSTDPPNPAPTSQSTHQPQPQEDQKENKQLSSSTSKGILRHQSALGRKPSVKRELRFSVPPVTSEEIFIPESPEQATPERCAQQQQSHSQQQIQSQPQPQQQSQQHQIQETPGNGSSRMIPVRVNSLSAADFMDLNEKCSGQRKRRRLGLGLRSRKAFKKKDKENVGEFAGGVGRVIDGAKKCLAEGLAPPRQPVVPTPTTRTFRRPKPVAIPRVPQLPPVSNNRQECVGVAEGMGMVSREQLPPNKQGDGKEGEEAGSDTSSFTHLKLYSPLRMFRCNSCHVKFCDNESLSGHITARHRKLLCLLRPQYGCGVCSAKFFENKYLVKHCLQHHTSLLEIRSPSKQKITLYRFTQE